jgi:hypothetical protein
MCSKQLEAELKRLSSEKKKLGTVLNSFEREFQRKNGRKIEKDDRQPMARDYQQYKVSNRPIASDLNSSSLSLMMK